MKSIVKSLRCRILNARNRSRLRAAVAEVPAAATPIYFIFTKDIIHLAPFCIPNLDSRFHPVLVMNGVSSKDVAWVKGLHKSLPLADLTTSLTGNPDSLLAHGDVLCDLFAATERDFCIQDPDCFVTDDSFWDHVSISDQEFCGAVYCDTAPDHGHVLPQTYFVMFNRQHYAAFQQKYSLDARTIEQLPIEAEQRIQELGYGKNEYPHPHKDYFDTLQAFWVLSLADGLTVRELPGRDDFVFHVGGTSYLHNHEIDPTHWDFWPLSVHYFNLRILEQDITAGFRPRFTHLFEMYKQSSNLLEAWPQFAEGWRRKAIDRILEHSTQSEAVSQP